MDSESSNLDWGSTVTQRQIGQLTWAAMAVWTVIVVLSSWWNVDRQQEVTYTMALNTARAAFNKDLAYRQWASSHGGVYVEPTDKTPPSPWMAHLPDRDLVTTDGRQLTLMNPAYMLREMMADFSELYGIQGRIVGIVYLNPNNRADPWEEAAIRRFDTREVEEIVELSHVNGLPHLRLIRPMFMQESCQKCHGHLGFPNGSVRGAVGVAVPMTSYQEVESAAIRAIGWSHGGIWVLGLVGLRFGGRRIAVQMADRERAAAEQRLAARMFENALEAMVITTPDATILRVNPAFVELTGYTREEATGRKANILRSFHHDETFYASMWESLLRHGRWQGEIINRRKDGSIFAAWENIAAVLDSELQVTRYYVASFRDITEQLATHQHIQHLAHFDPLTDLPNRTLFHDRLSHALTLARREDQRIAVLFLDLDGFKKVNDTLGHHAGDDLLVEVAQRLRTCLRQSDTVSRLGGDEFALILESLDEVADAELVARKLLASLSAPIILDGREIFVGGSIGISLFPDDGKSVDELLMHADTAMYQAKAEGKGCYRFYASEMTRRQERRMELEDALRGALLERTFEAYFQPKLALKGKVITGFEALVRWRHPALGLVSPVDFVPLAEELGLITSIDLLVLEQACALGRRCLERGYLITMAANLSSLDLKRPELVEEIARIIRTSGFPPERVILEITESFAMEMGQGGIEVLNLLRALGVQLAIDDFGTGFSSLGYLKQLPVASIKIDRLFVRDIGMDPRDTMLVSTIIGLAHSLKLKVVAEGVEVPPQQQVLANQDCDEIQGYLIARPMPADQVMGFLEGWRA
ncbi:MAG: EAL domain-containing protein [Magnetococcales bacterium]|nr:EAL domain-containing protein [Magnetococcales bacterium]NGZ07501.1 EAL domain-containing protein [Magnetococcales bacterium]